MKKILFVFLFLIAGFCLLFAMYYINAQFIEGRSIQSRMLQDIFAFTRPFTPELNDTIAAIQKDGREPWVWPHDISIDSSVSSFDVEGMTVYHLNERGSFPKKILHLHGGAYILGIFREHIITLDTLAGELDAAVLIPDYPLAPESNHRQSYKKVLALYKKCWNQPQQITLF